MCKIYNSSESGRITTTFDTAFTERYGVEVGRKVFNKVRGKKRDCVKRGVNFLITWEVLDLLVDKWVLGKGTCDYTGERFRDVPDTNNFPSLERVDSTLPYQEGNLCVITKRINSIKGNFESGINTDALSVSKDDREIFNKMWSIISSPSKMKSTLNHYIPKRKEETKMTATVKVEKEIVITTTQHEDIALSGLYSSFMKFFLSMGKDVELSFSQFKHIYKRKSCFLSGEKFVGDNKHPLLLGDKVTASTLTFAIEKYATPFQNLIDQSGMTPTLLLNNLNKNLK